MERGDRAGPGRVHAFLQRQRFADSDLRERKAGDLAGGDRQVLGGDGQEVLLLAVERREGAGIEGGQPAPAEVVVDLAFHRFQRGARGGRGVAEREHGRGVGRGFLDPGLEGRGVGEEGVHPGLVDAGFARAVGHRSVGRDDIRDQRLGGVVIRGSGHDDAVAVEDGLREDLGDVGGVSERDARGVLLAEVGEDLLRGGQDALAVGCRVVDGGQREGIAALDEVVGVLEQAAGPFHSSDEFGRAHPAVLVGVDQREGRLVELEAGRRTRERDPELLVELVEREEVGAGVELDLVESASAEEGPDVINIGHGREMRS